MGLTATTKILYNKNVKLDKELVDANNNIISYQNTLAGIHSENAVLRLNISDFRHSRDSLIQALDSTRKALKIKDNELKLACAVRTIIRDTTVIEIPVSDNCDFDIVIEKHEWSKYEISRKDNTFVHIPTIKNEQDLFVHNRKVWRNPNKKFIKRLLTLDFKKDNVLWYKILNTNPDIEVIDSRVINISE